MRDIPCRTFRSTNHTVPYLGLLTTVAGNITTLELRVVSGLGRKATWGASPRACIYFPDAAGIYANKCRAYGHRQSAALSGPGPKPRAALTAHHQGGNRWQLILRDTGKAVDGATRFAGPVAKPTRFRNSTHSIGQPAGCGLPVMLCGRLQFQLSAQRRADRLYQPASTNRLDFATANHVVGFIASDIE